MLNTVKYNDLFHFNGSDINDGKDDFFTDNNNPNGYFSKSDFVKEIIAVVARAKGSGKVRCWEVNHIEQLMQLFKLNARLTAQPTLVTEDGTEYIWCNFRVGNIRKSLKIINIGGRMFDFVTDYALAKIKMTCTFEELWEEATKVAK